MAQARKAISILRDIESMVWIIQLASRKAGKLLEEMCLSDELIDQFTDMAVNQAKGVGEEEDEDAACD